MLEKYKQIEITNLKLERELEQRTFSVDTPPEDCITFYTGFPSKSVFDHVFEYFNPGMNGENIIHVRNQ